MAKDSVAPHKLNSVSNPRPVVDTIINPFGEVADRNTRTDTLNAILENLHGDEAIIATTGKTGRELFTIADREIISTSSAAWERHPASD